MLLQIFVIRAAEKIVYFSEGHLLNFSLLNIYLGTIND